MFYELSRIILNIYFHILYNLHYEGRKKLNRKEAVIYVSNHRSNTDPPLVATGAKGKISFMAKEELFKNKLFAFLIRLFGAFPVARGKGDMKVIDNSVELLEKGRNLIIFPEGTRSKTGKVQKGHTGAALIAARSGKPIIPVAVIYGEKLGFRTKLTVKYGEPIMPQDYIDNSDEPNPRQLVKLKNRYMEEIKRMVEGEPEAIEEKTEAPEETKADE